MFLHGAPLVRSMLSTTFIVVVGLGVPLYVAASRFAEVGERKCYTSFVEECKRQVSVRVKGGTVKHLFVGSMQELAFGLLWLGLAVLYCLRLVTHGW